MQVILSRHSVDRVLMFLETWYLNLLENSWKSDPPDKFPGLVRVLEKTGTYKTKTLFFLYIPV